MKSSFMRIIHHDPKISQKAVQCLVKSSNNNNNDDDDEPFLCGNCALIYVFNKLNRNKTFYRRYSNIEFTSIILLLINSSKTLDGKSV